MPMKAPFAHARSMSSLITIVSTPCDLRECGASSPPRMSSDPPVKILDEYTTPLPPSIPSSEHGDEVQEEEKEAGLDPHARIIVRGEDTCQPYDVPLPPSGPSSEYGDDIEEDNTDPGEPREDPALEQDVLNTTPSGAASPSLSTTGPETFGATDTWTSVLGPTREYKEPVHELPMPLMDLLDLAEKEAYEREHAQLLQRHVHDVLHQCSNQSRSLTLNRYLYRRMFECFRTDKKTTFASLYSQSTKLKARSLSENGVVSVEGRQVPVSNNTSEPASWFSAASLESQHNIISFLEALRNDHTFLADRLVSLSSSDLHHLVRPHRQALAHEPMPDASASYGRFDPRNMRQKGSENTDQGQALTSMVHDPLFLLINRLFDPMAAVGSAEEGRQLDVWSSVCASVIQDGKSGSDEFCLVVMDCFADCRPWAFKSQLELYLQRLIHSGYFIVDSQATPSSDPTVPVEVYNAKLAVKTTQYFETALVELVELLTKDASFPGVPPAALNLVHATLAKINDPSKRHKAKSFFASRWYCTSFLSNALLFPERHQMLLNLHVSTMTRHKILREVAVRLQKSLYGSLSPNNSFTNLASSEVEAGTQRLLVLFDPPSDLHRRHAPPLSSSNDRLSISLSIGDILAVAKTLYPHETTVPVGGHPVGRPTSMASSVTGSSTLTTGTNGPRTGTSSSAAPSISGTSMTSTTLSSDMFFNSLGKNQGIARSIETPAKSRPSTTGGMFPRIHDHAVEQFMPELAQYYQMQPTKSRGGQQENLIIYIRNTDGKLYVHLGDVDREASSRPSTGMQPPTLTNTTPALDIIERGLSRAFSACRDLQQSPSVLSSLLPSSVETLFQTMLTAYQARQDYRSMHFWSKALAALSLVSAEELMLLISRIIASHGKSINEHQRRTMIFHGWILSLQRLQRQLVEISSQLDLHSKSLRDKMWFITDVRHSSAYESTVNVVRALEAMARPAQQKQTGMAAWARQRLRNSFGHERAQSQIFEALSASPDHCGPNKLSDTQADLIMEWLSQGSIENFCKGEERIHRFCFEIQKCARRLVSDALPESPVLWSSALYNVEKEEFFSTNSPVVQRVQQQHLAWTTDYAFANSAGQSLSPPDVANKQTGLGVSFSKQAFNSLPTSRVPESRKLYQDPGIYQTSETKPALPRDWTLPPSPISPTLNTDVLRQSTVPRNEFVERLHQSIIALLLSDLGPTLWEDGSETDKWFGDRNVPVAYSNAFDEFAQPSQSEGQESHDDATSDCKVANAPRATQDSRLALQDSFDDGGFSFDTSYRALLQRFQASYDPFYKLECLTELTELIHSSVDAETLINLDTISPSTDTTITKGMSTLGLGVPRTKLTQLEEVTANCEERRLMTQGRLPTINGTYKPSTLVHSSTAGGGADRATCILRALFQDEGYRPSSLFRDLQLIATFVPSTVLDHSPKGTAFWDVGLAAMGLKFETCKNITKRASEILAHHLNTSNHREPVRKNSGDAATQASDDPTMSQEDLAHTTLEDAARLFTISAMEGDPTAARELGLFYLTHPDLVRRVTQPLSKPSEVFAPIHGLGMVDNKGSGNSMLDSGTFAVAFHWMGFAANAGDADARTFLRENSDLGRAY